jgi:hypothetical protein
VGEDSLKRLLPLILLSGCVTAQPATSAVSVADVWAHHHEFDGKMIRVHGVVTKCYSLGCRLYQSENDRSKWLSIGTSETFDDAVQPFLGKEIIVEGRLRADCLHVFADTEEETHRPDGEVTVVICTDRASMIMQPELVGLAR